KPATISQMPSSQGDITGTIVDTRTRRPIRGATVMLGTHRATTDDHGIFRFTRLPLGQHAVRVRALGYQQSQQVVMLSTDASVVAVTVALEPSVSALNQVIVTGTVVATSQREVPNAMTVITAQDI